MHIEPIKTETDNRDESWENKLEKFSQNAEEKEKKKNHVTEYNRYREQNIET